MRNQDRLFGRVPALSELTPGRLASGVWRHGRDAIKDGLRYLTRPLRSEFQRAMIANLYADEPPVLGQLRHYDELKRSSWFGLAKFGYRLVEAHRPRVIVELGSYVGLSTLAMGLAQRESGSGGTLYAIDSWQGDAHAGLYGDSIYETFLERREALGLADTIVPLRMYFDRALDAVPRTIDLLHIDGLHTWDAVTHDWATYGPLVRPGGIVIFHDVNSIWRDVVAFWGALRRRMDNFTVLQSNGLGVVRIPATGFDDRLLVNSA